MNFDFGGALRRAWQITWKHKVLWIFGILSALVGRASFNGGGRPSYNPNNFNPSNPDAFPRLHDLFSKLDQNAIIAIALGLVCVGVIIAITLYVLHVIGRGGLIGGIQLADRTGQVSFGQAWGVGTQHFWTVLLIGLLVAIVALLVGSASFVAAVSICLAPLACIGFLVIAVLGVFTYLAQIAAVTENLSVTDAFSRAWQVVQANLGAVALMALILVIVEVIAGFVIGVPFLFAVAPLGVAFVAYLNGASQAATASAIVAGLCFVAWIPFAIVLGGILQTWVISTWTLTYQQLSGAPGSAMAPANPAPLAS